MTKEEKDTKVSLLKRIYEVDERSMADEDWNLQTALEDELERAGVDVVSMRSQFRSRNGHDWTYEELDYLPEEDDY